MPFKHNAARRHRIPQARYRVRNWPAYEAGLRRRGDLTLWLDGDALAGWHAPRRSTPGGQARYSDAAIELVLVLRLVFHPALRQAEGFAASVLRLLGQELRVPGTRPPRAAYRACVKSAFDLTGVLSSVGRDRQWGARWRSSPG